MTKWNRHDAAEWFIAGLSAFSILGVAIVAGIVIAPDPPPRPAVAWEAASARPPMRVTLDGQPANMDMGFGEEFGSVTLDVKTDFGPLLPTRFRYVPLR